MDCPTCKNLESENGIADPIFFVPFLTFTCPFSDIYQLALKCNHNGTCVMLNGTMFSDENCYS